MSEIGSPAPVDIRVSKPVTPSEVRPQVALPKSVDTQLANPSSEASRPKISPGVEISPQKVPTLPERTRQSTVPESSTTPPVERTSQPPAQEKHNPTASNPNENPWAVLGLDRGASAEEINKAFRRLSREYHPDANKDNPQAEEIFKTISEAYGNIKDDKHRQKFESQVKAADQASESDFNTATDVARTSINMVGIDNLGRYIDSRVSAAGKDPKSPEDVATLIPEIVDPIAEAIANPGSGEINRIISISSDELQVLKTLQEIYSKRRNPEASIALAAILELLIALIISMQIMQKAMAHEDWSKDFDEMISSSTRSGTLAKHLQLYVKQQRFIREQKEPKDNKNIPALQTNIPERATNSAQTNPISENQTQPTRAESPLKPPSRPEQTVTAIPSLPPQAESTRPNNEPPTIPQLPSTVSSEEPISPLHQEFIDMAKSTPEPIPSNPLHQEFVAAASTPITAPIPTPKLA